MKNTRQELTRDFVHVGDHQQKALGSRVGRRQGTSCQCTMSRRGSTTLRLHFNDVDGLAKNILAAFLCPLIRVVSHR